VLANIIRQLNRFSKRSAKLEELIGHGHR